MRSSDSGYTLLWFNLGFELQVVFPERTFRGCLQRQSNGAHSTLFSRIRQLLECYLATQNNRIWQRSRKQSKTALETYKLYILTNDTKFTKAMEYFICVDVTNESHYLTACFNAFNFDLHSHLPGIMKVSIWKACSKTTQNERKGWK